jgi:hypothetical protein
MKMQEVRKIAKKWGVNIRVGRSKQDIIRDIQTMEGHKPCFGTKETCDQYHCLWREDCIKE